ncbi:hypothetical protein, partial [Mesorhizobium sp. M7A.F.Ca.MR.362.00.0.0]|uniref:hypothetical protein n=1 Tax=Mesorhizobium sp. M7A.F.Ca.MR.362.00.0.0 TaxID=2496779 RepID=UPI0019D48869
REGSARGPAAFDWIGIQHVLPGTVANATNLGNVVLAITTDILLHQTTCSKLRLRNHLTALRALK